MSEIKNGGLDHYGAGPFEYQRLEQLALKVLTLSSPVVSNGYTSKCSEPQLHGLTRHFYFLHIQAL